MPANGRRDLIRRLKVKFDARFGILLSVKNTILLTSVTFSKAAILDEAPVRQRKMKHVAKTAPCSRNISTFSLRIVS